MTEKTEEQISRDRAAVESMKAAKANMSIVLERVAALESALDAARRCIVGLKDYIPTAAYVYRHNSSDNVKCVTIAENGAAAISAVLGR